ncbi:MAG: Gldg family protein, partial [Clostridia bacterium]|nr:Gldg family protein [Clostridia bacterium]
VRQMNTSHKLSKNTALVIMTAVLLVAIVLLNVGIGLIPRRFTNFVTDSSDAFSISAQSKSFFKGLQSEVTIYYVYDPEMTYDYDVAAKFRVMLDKYARLTDNVKIEYVDMDDEAFLSKYGASGLIGSSLIIQGPERNDVITYDELFMYAFPADGVLLSYAELYTVYSNWASMAESYAATYGEQAAMTYANNAIAQYYGINNFYEGYMEIYNGYNRYWYADGMITSSVDYVTTDSIPTTYVLTGHGEAALPESFVQSYLDGFSIRHFTLDLSSQDKIPANASTLVLNAPKSDITATEKALIEGFIAAGGSLILTTTPDAATFPNLIDLLDSYGLGMQNAIVYDDTLSYNEYLKGDQEQDTDKDKTEQEGTPDAQDESEDATEDKEDGKTEDKVTYPADYLYILPDTKHSLNGTADEVVKMSVMNELYSMYMAAMQQYQTTGNSMYQAYAQYYQQMYESYSQNDMNFQMLVVGAHPITFRETTGVSVKPLLTTSDKGYLSTDSTPATYNLGVTATITNDDNVGAIVWYGFAGSFEKTLLDEVYGYNDEFLYAALDWAGGTAMYKSPYTEIEAIDLGGAMDMHPAWMIGIAAFSIIVL